MAPTFYFVITKLVEEKQLFVRKKCRTHHIFCVSFLRLQKVRNADFSMMGLSENLLEIN